MVTEEEKIIICCNLLTGTLRGLEERARLTMCCKGTKMDKDLANQAVTEAERANYELLDILDKLVSFTAVS